MSRLYHALTLLCPNGERFPLRIKHNTFGWAAGWLSHPASQERKRFLLQSALGDAQVLLKTARPHSAQVISPREFRLKVVSPGKLEPLVSSPCRCLTEIRTRGFLYRGRSLTRKRTPTGPYRRPMPRVLGGSFGGWRCLRDPCSAFSL